MPHFAVLECIAIAFTLIVIKTGMAQPNSEEHGADVYQLARTSARPNTLIEITNRLTVPMVLLKKDLQFHGHTPLRPAPWNIDPMNFDAFLVSPLWFNKTGTYLSVYGAMVYEIREDQRSIAFALYFSVPDGHAQHRFPWFGLEIYANDFERRMRDALEADYKPEGGVTTLNSYYCRFSYASAQKTLKVDNADYKIIANMKMTSNTTATIKVSVQPSRQYRGAPRTPVISQPVAPIQVQILTSTSSTSSASTAAPVEETSLSPSTDASTHASVAQSEATSTSEKSSSSTSQVTEAGPTAGEITTILSSLSTVEASSSGDTSTVLPTTTAQAQDADETVRSTHEAASTTTQEEDNTTSKSSTAASKDTKDHTSTVTEHVSSSQSDQESTTIIQTSSTTTESNEDESTTSTTEAVDPTTTTTPPTNPDETMTDCDYDCIGEAQAQ